MFQNSGNNGIVSISTGAGTLPSTVSGQYILTRIIKLRFEMGFKNIVGIEFKEATWNCGFEGFWKRTLLSN